MSKKKYLLIGSLVFFIIVAVFIKIQFPYITITFLKQTLFPPASVVDSITQATLKIYTKKLTKQEIFDLININKDDRVIVTSTTNADRTAHAGVIDVEAIQEKIVMNGNPNKLTCKNIERSKMAMITVYKIPEKGAKWFQHIGARIWLKFTGEKTRGFETAKGKPLNCKYSMEIVAFRAI